MKVQNSTQNSAHSAKKEWTAKDSRIAFGTFITALVIVSLLTSCEKKDDPDPDPDPLGTLTALAGKDYGQTLIWDGTSKNSSSNVAMTAMLAYSDGNNYTRALPQTFNQEVTLPQSQSYNVNSSAISFSSYNWGSAERVSETKKGDTIKIYTNKKSLAVRYGGIIRNYTVQYNTGEYVKGKFNLPYQVDEFTGKVSSLIKSTSALSSTKFEVKAEVTIDFADGKLVYPDTFILNLGGGEPGTLTGIEGKDHSWVANIGTEGNSHIEIENSMTLVKHYLGLPDVEERIELKYDDFFDDNHGANSTNSFDDIEFIRIDEVSTETVEGEMDDNVRMDQYVKTYHIVFNKFTAVVRTVNHAPKYILEGMSTDFSYKTYKNLAFKEFFIYPSGTSVGVELTATLDNQAILLNFNVILN